MAMASASGHAQGGERVPAWLATWTASPQPVWGPDFLFPTNVPAVLAGQTVRQVARVSLGGRRLRLVLSNAYGKQPVVVGRGSVALAGTHGSLVPGSLRAVTYGGKSSAVIAPGAPLLSDPIDLPLPALARVTVSLYLPQATPAATFHWDGRATAWIAAGDQTGAARLDPAAQATTARLLLSGIEVEQDVERDGKPASARALPQRSMPGPPTTRPGAASPMTAGVGAAADLGMNGIDVQGFRTAGVVAAIGDSITDGAAATLDADTRWPDFLAEALAPRGMAVINAGISGARLLSDGMGVNALARLDRDVLSQPGVSAVVTLLGINDISWPGTAFEPDRAARPSLQALIAGYEQLIARAHARGVRVIGATLPPFEGALPGTPLADYYQPEKDALRQALNAWIRGSRAFDAVADVDAALRDPAHPARLAPRFDSGDHLHPGDAGNRKMAEVILPAVLDRGTLHGDQADFFSAAALSVASHENSGSERPKWP
ncbi:SGNH/GDSL hydrolase family protein [Bordetella genomosp. 10]